MSCKNCSNLESGSIVVIDKEKNCADCGKPFAIQFAFVTGTVMENLKAMKKDAYQFKIEDLTNKSRIYGPMVYGFATRSNGQSSFEVPSAISSNKNDNVVFRLTREEIKMIIASLNYSKYFIDNQVEHMQYKSKEAQSVFIETQEKYQKLIEIITNL